MNMHGYGMEHGMGYHGYWGHHHFPIIGVFFSSYGLGHHHGYHHILSMHKMENIIYETARHR